MRANWAYQMAAASGTGTGPGTEAVARVSKRGQSNALIAPLVLCPGSELPVPCQIGSKPRVPANRCVHAKFSEISTEARLTVIYTRTGNTTGVIPELRQKFALPVTKTGQRNLPPTAQKPQHDRRSRLSDAQRCGYPKWDCLAVKCANFGD
jgi:hypothetical protein